MDIVFLWPWMQLAGMGYQQLIGPMAWGFGWLPVVLILFAFWRWLYQKRSPASVRERDVLPYRGFRQELIRERRKQIEEHRVQIGMIEQEIRELEATPRARNVARVAGTVGSIAIIMMLTFAVVAGLALVLASTVLVIDCICTFIPTNIVSVTTSDISFVDASASVMDASSGDESGVRLVTHTAPAMCHVPSKARHARRVGDLLRFAPPEALMTLETLRMPPSLVLAWSFGTRQQEDDWPPWVYLYRPRTDPSLHATCSCP